jgi:hypothetical protein
MADAAPEHAVLVQGDENAAPFAQLLGNFWYGWFLARAQISLNRASR